MVLKGGESAKIRARELRECKDRNEASVGGGEALVVGGGDRGSRLSRVGVNMFLPNLP